MAKVRFLLMINGYDAEAEFEFDTLNDLVTLTQEMKKNGEILPRPKFTRSDAVPFEPFYGVVEKIEDTKTKNGKEMFIAHVRPDVGEGEPPKDLVAVKYMPPKQTWRIGDKVRVSKNDKGWLELYERIEGDPAPF